MSLHLQPFRTLLSPQLLVLTLILLLLALLPTYRPIHAADGIIYVDADAPASGDGENWATAYRSLQEALSEAQSGDQIWVAEGVYYPDESGNSDTNSPSATFILKNGVAIYGGFAGNEGALGERNVPIHVTILSGDITQNDEDTNGVIEATANIETPNSVNIVTASNTDSSAHLDGFVITGGDATNDNGNCPLACGGGLYAQGGSPTIANLTFIGNRATFGGGLFFFADSTPSLTDVLLTQNLASSGGGMQSQQSAAPTLTRVQFVSNIATGHAGGLGLYLTTATLQSVEFRNNLASGPSGSGTDGGGAMMNWTSSPNLNDVTFEDNIAYAVGGGLYNYLNSNPTLTDVRFVGNKAISYMIGEGGGLYNIDSSPTLTDVIFRANGSNVGGGMSNRNGNNTKLTNVTFIGNRAFISGGGLYNYQTTVMTMVNVVFAGNRAVQGGGISNSSSSPVLTNITLSGNQASEGGGAIYNSSSSPILQNGIVWGNSMSVEGDDNVANESGSSPSYTHSLVQDIDPSGIGNLDGTDAGNDPDFIRGVDCGSDLCTSDPFGGDEGDDGDNDDYGDLRLQAGSPAIDRGDNNADLDGLGAGSATITSIVTDVAGLPRFVAVNSLPAVVDMGAYEHVTKPSAVAGGPYTVNEGSPLALNGSTSRDDFQIVSFAWDCTNNGSVDVTAPAATGSTCTYPNHGSYVLRLTVTDNVNVTDTETTTVTVANVAPLYSQAPNQSTFAASSKNFTLGTFTDPGAEGSWSITVDWGDNSTLTQFTVASAGALPNKPHTYANPGTFNVVVTVNDDVVGDDGGFQVVVNAAPAGAPVITPPEDQSALAGVDATFALGSFSQSSRSGPWQVSVDWADSSTVTQFNATTAGPLANKAHTYASTGTYEVVVSVSDGELSASASFRIIVNADVNAGSVEGVVFEDGNANGTQDEGETGVIGVVIELESTELESAVINLAVNVAVVDLIRTTTTNANGYYRIDNIPPGGYTLNITPPAGYQIQGATQVELLVSKGETTTAPTFSLAEEGQGGLFLPAVQKP